MRGKYFLFIIVAQFFFCHFVFSQDRGVTVQSVSNLPAKEKRWALIIGVDTYQRDISPLYGTVNDAKALRDVLIKYAGFANERIILMTTDSDDSDLIPTRGNIIDQLDKLSRVVSEDGLILFSFSGHGVSIGNDAFIVPSDGRIYQNADLMRERAIDVLRIKRAIRATKVKQVIMFLDACRNDPIRAKGDVDNNLTTAYAKGFSFETKNQNIEAYATLYATSFGDRAYEFLDKKTNKYRGYFSYAIEEGLKGSAANEKGEITLASLIRYIEDTVKERVRINENQRQIPYPTTEGFRNSDLVIAFVERNPSINSNTNSGEEMFWQEMEKRNTSAAYQNYLAAYPNGEFSKIAKLKIGRLNWEAIKPIAKKMLKYDEVFIFSEGLAVVRSGWWTEAKRGFIDNSGKEIIPVKYDEVGSFSDGLAWIRVGDSTNSKYGFIDKTGKEIVPPKYDFVESFSEGLAKVGIGNVGKASYGFIDKFGNEFIPLKYAFAGSFSEGLASVKLNEKYGFIDRTGKVIIPIKYDFAESFSEGLARVDLNDNDIFIDKTGNKVMRLKYYPIWSFSEGLVGVGMNRKMGFIDRTSKVIIPLIYDFVGSFKEGLAEVRIGDYNTGKKGLIDNAGKEITSFKYTNAEPFSNALAKVWLNNKLGFIDQTGWEVIEPKYDRVWCESYKKEGFIGVTLNGKKGFVDIYGNEYFDF